MACIISVLCLYSPEYIISVDNAVAEGRSSTGSSDWPPALSPSKLTFHPVLVTEFVVHFTAVRECPLLCIQHLDFLGFHNATAFNLEID